MPALTIDTYGYYAQDNTNASAADSGNLVAEIPSTIELAALAQNKTVAVARIPAGAFILGLLYAMDALGATTGIKLGIQSKSGEISDDDFFVTVADSSSAGRGFASCVMPFKLVEDAYVVATQSGAGTATGTLSAVPLYVFLNQ
jgi:hypothetical protein